MISLKTASHHLHLGFPTGFLPAKLPFIALKGYPTIFPSYYNPCPCTLFKRKESINSEHSYWTRDFTAQTDRQTDRRLSCSTQKLALVDSSWNVMAHGDARKGKWRGNWWMEWVASTLRTTSDHGVSSITTADAHTSASSSRLNWRPRRFKWTRPFRRKTKSVFCACAIAFQLASMTEVAWVLNKEPTFFFAATITKCDYPSPFAWFDVVQSPFARDITLIGLADGWDTLPVTWCCYKLHPILSAVVIFW
jgi:hypothetical protein